MRLAVVLLLVFSPGGLYREPGVVGGTVDLDNLAWNSTKFWTIDSSTPEEYFPVDEGFIEMPKTPSPKRKERSIMDENFLIEEMEREMQDFYKCAHGRSKREVKDFGGTIDRVIRDVLGDLLAFDGSGEGSGYGVYSVDGDLLNENFPLH